jgi:hypothetical protein
MAKVCGIAVTLLLLVSAAAGQQASLTLYDCATSLCYGTESGWVNCAVSHVVLSYAW